VTIGNVTGDQKDTAEFRLRTPLSGILSDRLHKVLPGGETRSVTHYSPYPVAIREGHGPRLWDLDGNEYLDVLNNYTSLVHGNAFAPVVEAIQDALAKGSAFPAPHLPLADLAECLVDRFPGVELVRFTNSGTEAAVLAARIARAVTKRERIVMFEGGYHGTASDFVDAPSSTSAVPYNDLTRLEAVLDPSVAAIFVEPFLGSGGVIPAAPGFLEGVQELAQSVGALLVLDEVQSLRNAYDGWHGSQSLRPDLILMGKIIGGGLPVGAVGGRREPMSVTAADVSGSILHSGTFNGNPVTAAAGSATLQALTRERVEALNQASAQLADGIQLEGRKAGLPVTVTRSGSIMHVHLRGDIPRNAVEARRDPPTAQAALHLALLLEGVYAAPRGMLNLSTVTDAHDQREVLRRYGRAFERLRATA
jgi:glutamate-1-semialdehyde 2,1-aminomutase